MNRRLSLFICMVLALVAAPLVAQNAQSDLPTDPISNPTPLPLGTMCADIVINGTLGSGSPDWPSTSGTQTGRLNRNGISSLCGAPKVCDIFLTDPGRAYDAYVIPNNSGAEQCVSVELEVIDQTGCNLQVNAYADVYDPVNICDDYLADPGLSSGVPPNLLTMSFDQPIATSSVLVVHTTNPGETGCNYTLTVNGEICGSPAEPVIEVPSLRTEGMIALGLLLLGGAIFLIRRRG